MNRDPAAEHDAWFRREVQAGIDAANAGDVIPADEVEADAAAWRTTVEQGRAANGKGRIE
ncbi:MULTISPECIES: hypothetical protein [Klebsiella pneumoniae complex]|uniref:hypothetical protein n=1 Tax=Klebsiella pneumoniae complex TaxID=3390273 RepID=UPI000C7A647C|nr:MULTISPECIES: hypothetical protein [Klebsiella]MDK6239554.1 hypothetical protein [Klebsiella pneumoniae]PLJ29895.1 hypothetical protein B6J62_19055 [Klebsiella quasipneumoniae]